VPIASPRAENADTKKPPEGGSRHSCVGFSLRFRQRRDVDAIAGSPCSRDHRSQHHRLGRRLKNLADARERDVCQRKALNVSPVFSNG
jgi:hypothetical protein